MIDTSRIRYFLPILGPAQVVHYAQAEDCAFIEKWIAYLRDHRRVPSTVSTAVIESDPRRLVISLRDGHSERGDILRLGQSLVLHEGQFTVLDTDTLHQRFHVLRDPLGCRRHPLGS